MDQRDRLTMGATLALLGAGACIVGHLMEGIRGDVVYFVGGCVLICGVIVHDLRRRGK